MNLIDIYQLYLRGELSIADLADIFGTMPSHPARELSTRKPLTASLTSKTAKDSVFTHENHQNHQKIDGNDR